MGAAGDMLMAALLEIHPDPQGFIQRINNLHIPGVHVQAQQGEKCGIAGTQVSVTIHGEEEGEDGLHHHSHDHEHHHADIDGIEQIITHLAIPDHVRDHVRAVYSLIADAECVVHRKPVHQVHFHEVGMMDAVADIIGVCLLIDELGPDEILASPIHVGSGYVQCSHGILPVPAPATAHILLGIPIYGGRVQGELCTPTGAALIKHFASGFGPMPGMKVEKIGYGMGKKEFPIVNCVRAMLGCRNGG
jgi:uncharacterized protein (TIGR00299 family) protein